jgi:glycosyltransferase involved in cell wall biosynthesis
LRERKILVLQNYPTPYRDALFEALAALGIETTILYMHDAKREGRRWSERSVTRFTRRQARYFAVGKSVGFWFPGDLIAKHDCIILLDDNPTGLCMSFWSFVLRAKRRSIAVWIEHIPDSYKSRLKTAYQRICSKLLLRNASLVIPFSELSGIYAGDLGISRPQFRLIQATPARDTPATVRSGRLARFGFLGSDQPRKNIDALLEAFGSIGPGVELHIAGIDAISQPEDERVIYHGYLAGDALEQFFDVVDVLVLPSLADPWGLVVNEALSRGCLALVSDQCGSAELARQISPDLVCGTSAESIAAGMSHVASLDPQHVQNLRCAALQVMENYTIEAAAERLAAAIDRMDRR